MRLRFWRISNGMTLAQCAPKMGLAAASSLFDIEQGIVFPRPENAVMIEAVTDGAVTYVDHLRAWRARNPQQYSQLLAAGRSASKAFKKPAKPKKESTNGREGKRQRKP